MGFQFKFADWMLTQIALMLTQHTYFNLDAYKDPTTDKIWNHTLYMPYSKRYLVADDGALPTGEIGVAKAGSINDFASASDLALGHSINDPAFPGNCGAGGQCEGYNGYWLIEDAPKDAVVVTLASPFSGIKADLRTDQVGAVIYSCNWFDGTAALKKTQGLPNRKTVGRSSCVAIEAQDFVDGINQ
jgi:aldose 1-epimerase